MTICEFGAKSSQHSQTSAQLSRAGNTLEVFAVVLGAAADLSLSLSPSHKISSNKEICHRVSKNCARAEAQQQLKQLPDTGINVNEMHVTTTAIVKGGQELAGGRICAHEQRQHNFEQDNNFIKFV